MGNEKLHQTKVMVVDENPKLLSLLKSMLAACSIRHVKVIVDPVEAIALLGSTYPVDLVIVSWDMQKMDGLQLLHIMKNSPNQHTKQIPILMVGCNVSLENAVTAKEKNAVGFLTKPFSIKTLKNQLNAILGKKATKKKAA